ncbi:hypothetical protein B566_EDAN010795 [Ephemera danica]|nr:hypothetical protein B566_EDAN010795 [Ephemera danica]
MVVPVKTISTRASLCAMPVCVAIGADLLLSVHEQCLLASRSSPTCACSHEATIALDTPLPPTATPAVADKGFILIFLAHKTKILRILPLPKKSSRTSQDSQVPTADSRGRRTAIRK